VHELVVIQANYGQEFLFLNVGVTGVSTPNGMAGVMGVSTSNGKSYGSFHS
jgi:hypothetical protein